MKEKGEKGERRTGLEVKGSGTGNGVGVGERVGGGGDEEEGKAAERRRDVDGRLGNLLVKGLATSDEDTVCERRSGSVDEGRLEGKEESARTVVTLVTSLRGPVDAELVASFGGGLEGDGGEGLDGGREGTGLAGRGDDQGRREGVDCKVEQTSQKRLGRTKGRGTYPERS